MYKKTTKGICVKVEVYFLTKQERPNEEFYIWAYRINILNNRKTDVKLKERNWTIIDIDGFSKEIVGKGVIGEQPNIKASESYEYMSGIPLVSPSGVIMGKYSMETESGRIIYVDIPTFSLDSPYQTILLN